MESRRLVVWISAGILGFQGATLAFDLLNCTVLSWLFVRQHGLGVVVAPARGREPEGWGRRWPFRSLRGLGSPMATQTLPEWLRCPRLPLRRCSPPHGSSSPHSSPRALPPP